MKVFSPAPHVRPVSRFFGLLGLPSLRPFLSVFTELLSPSHSPLLPGLTVAALVRFPATSRLPLIPGSPAPPGRMIQTEEKNLGPLWRHKRPLCSLVVISGQSTKPCSSLNSVLCSMARSSPRTSRQNRLLRGDRRSEQRHLLSCQGGTSGLPTQQVSLKPIDLIWQKTKYQAETPIYFTGDWGLSVLARTNDVRKSNSS